MHSDVKPAFAQWQHGASGSAPWSSINACAQLVISTPALAQPQRTHLMREQRMQRLAIIASAIAITTVVQCGRRTHMLGGVQAAHTVCRPPVQQTHTRDRHRASGTCSAGNTYTADPVPAAHATHMVSARIVAARMQRGDKRTAHMQRTLQCHCYSDRASK